jgi:hypothetical protein
MGDQKSTPDPGVISNAEKPIGAPIPDEAGPATGTQATGEAA